MTENEGMLEATARQCQEDTLFESNLAARGIMQQGHEKLEEPSATSILLHNEPKRTRKSSRWWWTERNHGNCKRPHHADLEAQRDRNKVARVLAIETEIDAWESSERVQ